jgi:hypothetical protein
MIGHRVMGVSLVHMGRFEESRGHLDHAIALYDPVEHRALASRFGSDSGVTILGFRSLAVWFLGFPETALTDAERAIEDAREIDQAATLMLALCTATWAQIFCGNYSVASSFADELVALAGENGAAGWKSMGILQQCDRSRLDWKGFGYSQKNHSRNDRTASNRTDDVHSLEIITFGKSLCRPRPS